MGKVPLLVGWMYGGKAGRQRRAAASEGGFMAGAAALLPAAFFLFSFFFFPPSPPQCCPRDAGCGFVCKATNLPSLTHYGLTLKAVLFCFQEGEVSLSLVLKDFPI